MNLSTKPYWVALTNATDRRLLATDLKSEAALALRLPTFSSWCTLHYNGKTMMASHVPTSGTHRLSLTAAELQLSASRIYLPAGEDESLTTWTVCCASTTSLRML